MIIEFFRPFDPFPSFLTCIGLQGPNRKEWRHWRQRRNKEIKNQERGEGQQCTTRERQRGAIPLVAPGLIWSCESDPNWHKLKPKSDPIWRTRLGRAQGMKIWFETHIRHHTMLPKTLIFTHFLHLPSSSPTFPH